MGKGLELKLCYVTILPMSFSFNLTFYFILMYVIYNVVLIQTSNFDDSVILISILYLPIIDCLAKLANCPSFPRFSSI